MDECWFGLNNPVIKDKMEKYLLTLRKKNVMCIFATQNPAEIAKSEIASTIIQNCPTQIFLHDKKAYENIDAYTKMGMTTDEINLIAMSPNFTYFYKNELGNRLYSLALGAIELALFTQAQAFVNYKGERIEWINILKYFIHLRNESNEIIGYATEILDILNVDYKHLLGDLLNE